MIKINLLGEDTAIDYSGVYQVAGYCASVLVSLGLFYFMYSAISTESIELTRDTEELELQLENIKKKTAEVRELEKKRQLLRDKLAVIATLKRNQAGPVRVLDDMNISLPEKSWVKEIKEKGGLLRVVGLALDNQTIAVFMKNLEASDYFKAVNLVETRQTTWQGVKMKKFTLSCDVDYAGKIRLKELIEKEAELELQESASVPAGIRQNLQG